MIEQLVQQGMDPETLKAMQEAQAAAAQAQADAATAGAMAGLISLLVQLPILIFFTTAMMGIFIKANRPWWAALVPIYNGVVILQIIGKPIWWLFIPIINVWVMFSGLAKSFGKDVTYALGLIFLGIIFLPHLAFGDARYQGPAG
jgi:hypothetical protein